MIVIDGSHGEGGGQILRTSLALSMITGKPFRIEKLRANRDKPGLQRQHLTAVLAAGRVSNAQMNGAALHSQELEFWPGKVEAGKYTFPIGTAGSTTLVFQTILPALMLGEAESEVVLEGGTHNHRAPPFEFLERTFLPVLRRMGPAVQVKLERWGFYPAGGGRWWATIHPVKKLDRMELMEVGNIVSKYATAVVAELPLGIAEREAKTLARRLNWPAENVEVKQVPCGTCAGNYVIVEIQSRHVTEVVSAIGQRGRTAEAIAEAAAQETLRYLATKAPVGEHLADQLLLPMALAGEGRYRTGVVSSHARTNMETIQKFLPVPIATRDLSDRTFEVVVG